MEYQLVRSKRRTLALKITREGELIACAPYKMPVKEIERFISEKRKWIEDCVRRVSAAAQLPVFSAEEIEKYREKTKELVNKKVPYYAELLGVSYGKISVRKQKTVWGSCSRKGDLSFNLLLSAVRDEIADYVVVHELCHRKRMDHSPAFWKWVEKICPDYKTLRKELQKGCSDILLRVR